jgi:hypothetical protein
MLTTKKIETGRFDVLWNGGLTKYSIVNGSLGMSGYGPNHYGIVWLVGDCPKIKWIGSLASCKKALALSLSRPG